MIPLVPLDTPPACDHASSMTDRNRRHPSLFGPVPMGFDQITCKGSDSQAGCIMSDGSRCPQYEIGWDGCFYYNGDQPWPDLDADLREVVEAGITWLKRILGGPRRR